MHTIAKALAALAASVSLTATPVMAATMSSPFAGATAPMHPAVEAGEEIAQRDRWYGRRHRHGGIDAGDVIAGVLIIGGIAAIASAASKNNRDRDERYRDYPDRPYDNRDRRYDDRNPRYDDRDAYPDRSQYGSGRGIDRAVDICVREVERDERVDRVENVGRTADGWSVEGELSDGRPFRCEIDSTGRVRDVEVDSGVAANDRQWDDERYARARNAREGGFEGGI